MGRLTLAIRRSSTRSPMRSARGLIPCPVDIALGILGSSSRMAVATATSFFRTIQTVVFLKAQLRNAAALFKYWCNNGRRNSLSLKRSLSPKLSSVRMGTQAHCHCYVMRARDIEGNTYGPQENLRMCGGGPAGIVSLSSWTLLSHPSNLRRHARAVELDRCFRHPRPGVPARFYGRRRPSRCVAITNWPPFRRCSISAASTGCFFSVGSKSACRHFSSGQSSCPTPGWFGSAYSDVSGAAFWGSLSVAPSLQERGLCWMMGPLDFRKVAWDQRSPSIRTGLSGTFYLRQRKSVEGYPQSSSS